MTAPSGFTPISWALSLPLPGSHRAGQHLVAKVLVAICQDVDESDHVVTSAPALAGRLGGVDTRQVGESIRILREIGLLIRTRNAANGTEHKINFGWSAEGRYSRERITDTGAITLTDEGHSTTTDEGYSTPPDPDPVPLFDDPHPLIASTSVGSSSVVSSPSESGGGPGEEKPRRGRRLPDAWTPRPDETLKCLAAGLDVGELADNFRDYWTAAAGQRAVKLDWDAAFRMWIRKQIEITADRARRETARGGTVSTGVRLNRQKIVSFGPNVMQQETY